MKRIELMQIQNRAITLSKLAAAQAKATNINEAYEAQRYLELEIEKNQEVFDNFTQEELGFVGDVRKFPPLEQVMNRGAS